MKVAACGEVQASSMSGQPGPMAAGRPQPRDRRGHDVFVRRGEKSSL